MKLDDAFGIHQQALQLRARRAEVLASNIANADTPGYKAQDFDFKSMLSSEISQPVRMHATQSGHMQTESGVVPPSSMSYRVPSQPSLDGNTVDTQIEHAAFASNAMEYTASLNFLSGKIQSLLTAIKGQ
ncbi:MAG: flagellar basal body rod protein FlgB [Sedimenticola sp.]|jgi:flagellar basal-body rod protein FlgB|nr:MAG: flagellar basal body rod protein FlgB [Sedimenticola sp.]